MNIMTLPKDDMIERALLGLMFKDENTLFTAIENLIIEDFYSTRHQIIFGAIKKLFSSNQTINIPLLNSQLTKDGKVSDIGGISYVLELTQTTPINYNPIEFCDRLRQLTFERKIYNIISLHKEGKATMDEVIQVIADQPTKSSELDDATLQELMMATLKKSSEGVAHKFGIDRLNYNLGGVDRGETIVIGGYTSQGKSSFALQLAMDFADQNKNVLYCSSEMSKLEITRRILASKNKINTMDFRKGFITEKDKSNVKWSSETYGKAWKLRIEIAHTTLQVKSLIQKHNPDIVFIDHLQNFDREGKGLSDYQRVTYNMRDINNMALTMNKTIFVLSQLRRKAMVGKPGEKVIPVPELADLRDSGAIEEKAHMVLFVYWKKRLIEDSDSCIRVDEEKPETLRILVAKNRDGTLGNIPLAFFPEYNLIREFELGEKPDDGFEK